MTFSTSRRGPRWGVTVSLLGLVVACGGHRAVSGAAGGSSGASGGSSGASGGSAGVSGGSGPMCGGQLCSADQVCCGPAECGHCVGKLSGANCAPQCPSGGAGGSGGSSGSSGEAGTSGGHGGNAGTAGSGSGPCPVAPPVDGTPCTPPYTAANGFAECTYGNDPRPQCRTEAVCKNSTWQVTMTTCSAPPLPAACPSTPQAEPEPCSDTALSCWYEDGSRCWCSACSRGSPYPLCQTIDPPQLFCASPSVGCPAVMPNSGTPCTSPGASCGPDCMRTITCTDGIWQWGGGMCPICASPETPIATPDGERSIASLRVGDLVYSVDRDAIAVVPLLKVEHTSVARHRVVRVVLEDGRVLEISPGHPTADGRTFGDLLAGSKLDTAHSVLSAELVPYTYDATFDILPASSTGTYFAAGALIGSTLFRR